MDNLTDKINVLHLLSSFGIGGLEKLLVDLMKANKNDRNSNINFIVAVMNENADKKLSQELIETGTTLYFLNRNEGHKHPKYLFMLLDIIKKHNIRIIHSHNPGGKNSTML